MVGELFNGIRLVPIGHEKGVACLHDDEVINAEEGDFDSFLVIEDDVVLGVDLSEFAVSGIVISLFVEILGD